MRKQEEDRFQAVSRAGSTNADQDTMYAWLEEFVVRHEAQILSTLPDETRRRIQKARPTKPAVASL